MPSVTVMRWGLSNGKKNVPVPLVYRTNPELLHGLDGAGRARLGRRLGTNLAPAPVQASAADVAPTQMALPMEPTPGDLLFGMGVEGRATVFFFTGVSFSTFAAGIATAAGVGPPRAELRRRKSRAT